MAPPDSDLPAVIFRPAPMWRRAAIYCLFGCLVCIGVYDGMDPGGIGPDRGVVAKTVISVVLGLVATVPALLAWRSAIRIDAEGIWRRRLIEWDCWPWDAFLEGKIKDKSSQDSFVYPEKRWYWRYVYLEFLTEEDRKVLHEVIRGVRHRPEIALPEQVTISFGFRRHASFTADAVQLWPGKQQPGPVIPWEEMSTIELSRIDHERRDFRELKFSAPAGTRPILLTFNNGSPIWSGADAELISAFLERHAPQGRLHVNAMGGPPLDLEEYDRRIAKNERSKAKLNLGNLLLRSSLPFWILAAYSMVEEKAGKNPLNWDLFGWLGFLYFNGLFGMQLLVVWGAIFFATAKTKGGPQGVGDMALGTRVGVMSCQQPNGLKPHTPALTTCTATPAGFDSFASRRRRKRSCRRRVHSTSGRHTHAVKR